MVRLGDRRVLHSLAVDKHGSEGMIKVRRSLAGAILETSFAVFRVSMAAFSERTPFCPFSRWDLSAMVQMEKAVWRGGYEKELGSSCCHRRTPRAKLDPSEYDHSKSSHTPAVPHVDPPCRFSLIAGHSWKFSIPSHRTVFNSSLPGNASWDFSRDHSIFVTQGASFRFQPRPSEMVSDVTGMGSVSAASHDA